MISNSREGPYQIVVLDRYGLEQKEALQILLTCITRKGVKSVCVKSICERRVMLNLTYLQ